jgi:ribosomal protein L37AE/L43A
MPAFSAWSFLSLDTTASGELVYPDELSVRCVYDTEVPNGRYVAPGDLAVIRDNRTAFGAGWIDSIVAEPGRKIRYRCPNCTSAKLKRRRTALPLYRCQVCTAEFDIRVEEELQVQVFTANYSRTWRSADKLFPEEELGPAYVAKAQQNAIRRLDSGRLRPILET